MGNETLQALSKKYAYGEISKPEYRLQRQNIIDEITGIRQTNLIEDRDEAGNPVVDASHSHGQRLSSSVLLKAGVISAAVVLVLILMYTTI